MNRRTLLASAGALTASTLAGCIGDLTGAPVSESFSQSYTVSPETTVLISNRNGPISVRQSESDKLTVSGEKQAGSRDGFDSITIDVVEGDRFVINVRFSAGSDFSNRQVDLTIGIPDGAAVDGAHTATGDVTITEVRGDLKASTTNGNVEVTDVSGFIRGETTNGNVRIRNCTGVTGARTSNGNIEVELLAMRNDVTCYSANGNVTVGVGSDVSAAIRLSTNTGNAQVRELPHTTEIDRRGYIAGSLRGGNSPVLFLGSNNGNVTL